MNLARTQKILLAVERCPKLKLQVHRPRNEADVREMVEAGLIRALLPGQTGQPVTVLEAVTDAGNQFLRAFPQSYRFCEARG